MLAHLKEKRFLLLTISAIVGLMVVSPLSVAYTAELNDSQIEIIKRDVVIIGVTNPEFVEFTIIDTIKKMEKT